MTTPPVNRQEYHDESEPIDPNYALDIWDQMCSADEPWEYLLKKLEAGELHAEVRGKQIVIICGY